MISLWLLWPVAMHLSLPGSQCVGGFKLLHVDCNKTPVAVTCVWYHSELVKWLVLPWLVYKSSSLCLTKWKLIALKLGISQADVEIIASEKVEMQGVTLLKIWKQRNAFKATYRALVVALLSIGQAEDASGICQILKGNTYLL